MCMEDVRLGRKTASGGFHVTVGTNATELVPYSVDRVSLIIFPDATTDIFLAHGSGATLTAGRCLKHTDPPLVLDIQHHGSLVNGPLSAIAAAPVVIGCLHTSLAER